MNGLTYFRFKSPYAGDITKNCALNGVEVDNNFYTLEGRDVESVTVVENDLVLRLVNGVELRAKDIRPDNVISDIEFDQVHGVLRIVKNGEVEEIGGFNTRGSNGVVAVDGTLVGNGSTARPIGISPIAKSGQYAPVDMIIEAVDGKLPPVDRIRPGFRAITYETIPDYGFLYDYEAVKRIACILREHHSEWRIPTKEDWDDMLDAVEPCVTDKNHSAATNNRYLGKWAGKLLKSVGKWKEEEHFDSNAGDCDFEHPHHGHHGHHGHHDHHHNHCECNDTCFDFGSEENESCAFKRPEDDVCHPVHIGTPSGERHKRPIFNCGLDEYGFSVVPAGYADDGENFMYFGERAYFWTASNSKFTSAYVKRFEFNSSAVHQDILASQNHLSLRLVKAYNGDNYSEREEILGNNYDTVLMPSAKHGHNVWTSTNLVCNHHALNALIPNDGQNLTSSNVYFINEWTGKRWLRARLQEGETVLVKKSPRHRGFEEYMLKDGRLISVADSIRHSVIGAFKHDVDELSKQIDEKLAQINANADITNETIAQLRSEYDEFVRNANDMFDSLSQQLTDEETNRVNADNDLSNRINAEIADREQAIEALSNSVAAGDEELNGKIDEVAANLQTLTNTVDELSEDLDDLTETVEKLSERHDADQSEMLETVLAIDERLTAAEGDLLVQEGSGFDEANGIVNLKSADGSNDVAVQLKANFGEF